jgi:uncharacterized coiled-coil protein SlyX
VDRAFPHAGAFLPTGGAPPRPSTMSTDPLHPRVDRLEEAQMFAERHAEQLAQQMAALERSLAAVEKRLRTMEDRLGEIQRGAANADPDPA